MSTKWAAQQCGTADPSQDVYTCTIKPLSQASVQALASAQSQLQLPYLSMATRTLSNLPTCRWRREP